VLRVNSKKPIASDELFIVSYPQRILIQEDMAIRAETKNVLRDIRTVMRAAERLDVTYFRIRTCRCYKSGATDLAGKVIQLLHPVAYRRAAHDPSDC
jgi:hypothetical protein